MLLLQFCSNFIRPKSFKVIATVLFLDFLEFSYAPVFPYKLVGVSRLKENIIFESSVLDWFECGALCLNTRFCVGYNFKKISTDDQINCQLTHTGDQTFERISYEDNGWTFYETAGKKIVGVKFLQFNCKFYSK